MEIIQMLPTISYGDAVGNHVLALDDALKSAGYKTKIFAENIDRRLPRGTVRKFEEYKDKADNVIIFHLSIGSKMADSLLEYKARVVIVYHNVTPPEFFESYSYQTKQLCEDGLACVRRLAERPELCMADSQFNKEDLIRMGYKCPIEVLPILIAFDDYEKKPNQSIIEKYRDDGYVNILFTGRIAPNKKQEDLIASFYYYKNYINPKSRLFIVGSLSKGDAYSERLQKYVDELELNDVIFTGHIPFDEILAYYHIADLFLCLSEHEGFCVPLVEAMYFGIPIIAYDSTAVGETLGGSGLLLREKDPRIVAEAINIVISNQDIKKKMLHNERKRLDDFDNERIRHKFMEIVSKTVQNNV